MTNKTYCHFMACLYVNINNTGYVEYPDHRIVNSNEVSFSFHVK